MKHSRTTLTLICTLLCTLMVGCKKNNAGVWDDEATAGNYKGSTRSLWGHDEAANDSDFFGPNDEDFIGLKDEDLRASLADAAIAQPKFSPGERGSGLPGIDGFYKPTGAEAAVFKNVHFNTDEHVLKEKDSLETIERIVSYLKSHPNISLFISGHCDERGPEAYNLSLGTRRADSIRSTLVKHGVDPERIHTVSYGKEKPADFGHNPEAWAQNRRGEFRIYQK